MAIVVKRINRFITGKKFRLFNPAKNKTAGINILKILKIRSDNEVLLMSFSRILSPR